MITAAIVAAVASIIVALLQRHRRENSVDHALVMDTLRSLGRKVDGVDGKVDRHIEWHVSDSKDKPVKK
jgi:hypothetical protein